MREIKFRAWDKLAKELLEPQTIQWFMVAHLDKRVKEDFILMQYTGLKDKNGKEIYFGDILATSNSDPKYDIWVREHNGYTIVQEENYFLGIKFSNWWISEDNNDIYSQQFIEVIGNIYEDKHLLNK